MSRCGFGRVRPIPRKFATAATARVTFSMSDHDGSNFGGNGLGTNAATPPLVLTDRPGLDASELKYNSLECELYYLSEKFNWPLTN